MHVKGDINRRRPKDLGRTFISNKCKQRGREMSTRVKKERKKFVWPQMLKNGVKGKKN